MVGETAFAQCTLVGSPLPSLVQQPGMIELNLVTDFSADPSGATNSYCAFRSAAVQISLRGGYCTLHIPAGTYLVNPQVDTVNGDTIATDHAFTLYGKTHVEILGDPGGGTYIRYRNALDFGVNQSLDTLSPYSLFFFQNSSFITLADLHADGGSDAANVGLTTDSLGDHNLQPPLSDSLRNMDLLASGVDIWFNCYDITVRDCSFRHFCMDGIHLNGNPGSIPEKVSLVRVQCDSNGRQGLICYRGE